MTERAVGTVGSIIDTDATSESPSTGDSSSKSSADWSKRISVVAVLISLAAVAVAGWAVVSVPAAPAVSAVGQSTSNPKAQACLDYAVVAKGVALQTHASAEPDSVAAQVIDTNSRLVMSAGASYLLARLDPATPAQLADGIRKFASDLQDISIYAQSGVSYADPAEAARLSDAQKSSDRVAELCK